MSFMAGLAGFLLKVAGWKIEGSLPSLKKYILIVAPHTSNWDFILMLCLGVHWRALGKTIWFGKHTIFVGWMGRLFKAIGGIPIDRSQAHHIVNQTLEAMGTREELILALAPEGTRKFTDHWKSGFYVIAMRTGLPVGLGFINYRDKIIGVSKILKFTGNESQDWALLQTFYQKEWAKYPSEFSEVKPRRRT